MSDKQRKRQLTRRDLLKLGGRGALVLAAGGLIPGAISRLASPFGGGGAAASSRSSDPLTAAGSAPLAPASVPDLHLRLAATDGFISLPGRGPLYVFGFLDVTSDLGKTPLELDIYKGLVRAPAPTIGVDEDTELQITLTNIGLQVRPDLDDAHTIHWHGFRNPLSVMDGVPEVSIAVPPARDFNYFFRPHEEGTYFYHCHFEDVEHVQMGMVGIVYVRPSQNSGTLTVPPGTYAYNDGDGSTRYDREWTLLLNDIDPRPHDNLADVQEFLWTDYKANYWVINGRSYPDTLAGNLGEVHAGPHLERQPISSLIQLNEGETGLLRMANQGYEEHTMQLLGITMNVVGRDATFLGATAGTGNPTYNQPARGDTTYRTNTIYMGPSETRDVLFTAPDYVGSEPYNTYFFRNRNVNKLVNLGLPGLGGMATEVRVYPAGTLPAQTYPNQTYTDIA